MRLTYRRNCLLLVFDIVQSDKTPQAPRPVTERDTPTTSSTMQIEIVLEKNWPSGLTLDFKVAIISILKKLSKPAIYSAMGPPIVNSD